MWNYNPHRSFLLRVNLTKVKSVSFKEIGKDVGKTEFILIYLFLFNAGSLYLATESSSLDNFPDY